MKRFRSKYTLLPGSSYDEVLKAARKEYNAIKKLTKRQPYARSKYFNKEKIFLSVFWDHNLEKHRKVQTRRLKLYKAAIDLLRNTRIDPETIFDNNNLNTLLHRFYGITEDGVEYCVQVKHNKRTGRKDFVSVFDRKTSKIRKPSAL